MKRIKYFIIGLVAVLFTSCNYLNQAPDNILTLPEVFNNKNDVEMWLAGVYSNIPDPYTGNLTKIEFDALGDDFAPSPRWSAYGWNVINKQVGNWNPTTSWVANWWVELPKRIRSAYIFIANVKPLPAQLVTQADADNMKNEAKFMIAYYYWLLAYTYGGVPFVDHALPTNSSQDSLMIGQTPFYDVIDWVDNQLTDLSTKLPVSYSDPQKYGRVTSISCLAVRAQMRLFAASPLVNGNPMYTNFKNNKGQNIFSTQYDASRWQKAYDGCKELITKAEAAGAKLFVEYNDQGQVDAFQTYSDLFMKTYDVGNTEILWSNPKPDYGHFDGYCTPRGAGGNGGLGLTQELVDAFFMKNGSPITDPNSGYTEKGFSTQDEYRNTNWSEFQDNSGNYKGRVTMAGTYNMYCNREPRFYVTVLYNRCWYRPANRKTFFLTNEQDGGPTHDAPQNGYLNRKKVDPYHDSRNSIFHYRDGILYRLGGAYLDFAECACETNHLDEAISYVNKIRHRAYVPEYGAGTDANGFARIPYTNSQDYVRKLVRMERRVELCCEDGITYFDIRRWLVGEDRLNRTLQGMNFGGSKISDNASDPAAYFVRVPFQTRIFTKKNYWFPVPQAEIDKNPNLIQNPFWTTGQ